MKYALFTATLLGLATTARAEGIAVKDIGGFHIGGKTVVLQGLPSYETQYIPGGPKVTINPNGDFAAFQMYVQYVKLEKPKAKFPLLLWHGGGLSGVTWEDTPDGRKGWQWFFLRAGHDVYVSDAVERGRATWARYPEINKSAPVFRPSSQAWESFRIGPKYDQDPAKRETYAGTQFPYQAFEQFTRQSTPRWTDTDQQTLDAYKTYVDKMFPQGCVILSHSQSSWFVWKTALALPREVKGIVLVEPSSAPDNEEVDLASLKNIPVLFLFGDLNTEYWQKHKARQLKWAEKLKSAGIDVTWIEMPDRGVKGNTHMIMMDKNSDQVAQVIQDWMVSRKLMK